MSVSFSNKIWNFLKPDESLISSISSDLKISSIAARILANRGVANSEEASSIINVTLRNTIPEPFLLLDMDKGIKRLIKALEGNQNITILGDYDVDGITSTCLMVKFFKHLNYPVKSYIPNRFADGYGVSDNSINVITQNKTDLLIVVDSGINAINEIDKLNALKIDTVIIDHHAQTSNILPNACAVINPNRIDQEEINKACIKDLSAAGVVFLFLIALRREIRNLGLFKEIKELDLRELSDIAALGTLCDVMNLKGINRALLKYTLGKNQYSLGIRSLIESFNIPKIQSSEDLSFFIGPAINSAGRIGDPNIALNLFLEDSPTRAKEIATTLYQLNKQRKVIEKQVLADAINIINKHNLGDNKAICVFENDWNEGVIGIVAGKLKDKFQKPVFVISVDKAGNGKGSVRSTKGTHIGEFLEKARSANLITKGGGHELAGGFSISKENIPSLISLINSEIKNDFQNVINIDYKITANSSLDEIAKSISTLEPFGKGLEKPVFCLTRIRIKSSKLTSSGNHVIFNVSNEFNKGNIKGIIFNASANSEWIKQIEDNKFELLDIVGSISYSEQFGSSLIIDDIRLS